MTQVAPEDQRQNPGRQKTTGAPSGSAMERPKSLATNREGPDEVKVETPGNDTDTAKLRSGPSSRKTVLSIAGLFVVGMTLIISGIIAIVTQHNYYQFQWVGAIFITLGILMWIGCLIVQKKNVRKFVQGLDDDLYFLNLSSNPVWKTLFEDDETTTRKSVDGLPRDVRTHGYS